MRLQDTIVSKLPLLLFVLSSFLGLGQEVRGDKVWHQGEIVLNTSDTLDGLIKYNFRKNVIEYKKGSEYRILLPNTFKEVTYTSLMDSTSHKLEVFTIQTSKNYFRPYFFELEDTTGRIKIYKQYYWEQKTVSTGLNSVAFGYGIRFILYKINNNKVASYIVPKKKFVLRMLKDKKQLVKEKVKEERWRYNDPYQLIQIIKYYNTLFI